MLVQVGRIDRIVDPQALRSIEQLRAIDHASGRIIEHLGPGEHGLGGSRELFADLDGEAGDQAAADRNLSYDRRRHAWVGYIENLSRVRVYHSSTTHNRAPP